MDAVVARYLAARDGRHGGLLGQLVCPVSRLPALVKELARSGPARPVDVSLVVDTGLGAVPKALSTVFSRSSLLTPRTIETAAPVDVDAMWLERVAEFVPDDVVAVVEPRRPVGAEEAASRPGWTRCAGSRSTAARRSCGAAARGRRTCRPSPTSSGSCGWWSRPGAGSSRWARCRWSARRHRRWPRHGVLNLLVGAARALAHGAVAEALASTDGPALAARPSPCRRARSGEVRALLPRCGAGPAPVPAARAARTCACSAPTWARGRDRD